METDSDNRQVALIKSLATNNRFYALVAPDRGIRNADTVEKIPDDLLLGIAYPCLEDGLNDFAVIRTTFETLDYMPDDDPIREEMMEIINDARSNLLNRLNELRTKISARKAHFLGTDYQEFKNYALDIAKRGYPRRNLDSMMKLNVFSSVAEAECAGDSTDLLYRFEFSHGMTAAIAAQRVADDFLVTLFQEIISNVEDDDNYRNKYEFDRNVFQRFIAVMFVNYATTDPIFYGINKRDYGVSGERDMESTPLYIAIGRELREIEAKQAGRSIAEPTRVSPHVPIVPESMAEVAPISGGVQSPAPRAAEPGFFMPSDTVGTEPTGEEDHAGRLSYDEASSLLPGDLVTEEVLMGALTSLCSAASLLMRKSDPETQRFARIILKDASKLVHDLKRLGVVSALVNDPGAFDERIALDSDGGLR